MDVLWNKIINIVSGVAEQKPGSTSVGTDIPGLSSRVNRPLEFLGLYGTSHGACRRHDIPARRVTIHLFYCLKWTCHGIVFLSTVGKQRSLTINNSLGLVINSYHLFSLHSLPVFLLHLCNRIRLVYYLLLIPLEYYFLIYTFATFLRTEIFVSKAIFTERG